LKRIPSALIVLVVVALGVSIVAGCTNTSPAPLKLTEADSGSTQDMAVGQELQITLDANPTTGYRWSVDGRVPDQLEQVGAPKYTASSKAIGAGGSEVWMFKGKASGEGVLDLKYWRTFEPTASPAANLSVAVKIK